MALNSLLTTRGGIARWTPYIAAATTIAAGSDTAVLPQATINVASTVGFAAASASNPGFIVIEIAGVDVVVQYTGLTTTQFTGCTLGVGTLATGQNVRQANVHNFAVPGGKLGVGTVEAAFAANATNDRGIRFRVIDFLFNFPGGTKTEKSCATQTHHIQSGEQPGTVVPGNFMRFELFQDSGGNLNTVVEALSAPRIVMVAVTGFSAAGVNT